METKYLRFELVEMPADRKTSVTNVVSKSQGSVLGQIKWYGPWRQYCFFPSPGCLFNITCMNDICRFIETLRG